MKLLQLNFWLGNLMHPAFQFIEAEQPDIICAQEILSSDVANPLYDTYQLHQRLSERYAYSFFAPTYGFISFGEKVELGNAIYSKYPLDNQQIVFSHGEYVPLQNVGSYARNIRNLQTCLVALPDGSKLFVANHHGFHDLDPSGNEETSEAMRKVASTLAQINGPLIFAGDLNINPSSQALTELKGLGLRNLTQEKAIATTLGPLSRVPNDVACDYIFVSKAVEVIDFYVSEESVSDHKAVVLKFEL